MPKLTVATKVGTPHNLKGAVPSSELAGHEFHLEMLNDAINFHEVGDDEDGSCCSGEAPCATRLSLVRQHREISARVRSLREDGHRVGPPAPAEVEEVRIPSGGSGRIGGQAVADPASDAQIRYIRTLMKQKDLSKLGTFPARTLAEIQDGHEVSKRRASSLIEAMKNARDLVGSAGEIRPEGPSDKQLSLIQVMCAEQGREIPSGLTKRSASGLISDLMKARETRTPSVTKEGMYRTPDGSVYKVQIAIHGSGRPYAKKLVEHDGEWVWQTAPGVAGRLTDKDRMSLDEAKKWGKLYGTCCVCGITLTKEESITEGIGPVCGGKKWW